MTAHGSAAYFGIEDSAGTTLRNIGPYVNSTTFNHLADSHDVTGYGSSSRSFISGLKNATISIAGFWDDTASVGSRTVLAGLVGLATTVGFEWGPEGNTTGDIKESGECYVTSYVESAPVGDVVTFTAEIQVSGAITVGTFS